MFSQEMGRKGDNMECMWEFVNMNNGHPLQRALAASEVLGREGLLERRIGPPTNDMAEDSEVQGHRQRARQLRAPCHAPQEDAMSTIWRRLERSVAGARKDPAELQRLLQRQARSHHRPALRVVQHPRPRRHRPQRHERPVDLPVQGRPEEYHRLHREHRALPPHGRAGDGIA